MKFSAILLTTLASAASAFSPSSNGRTIFTNNVATDSIVEAGAVDKTLQGIDGDAKGDFDPLGGDSPALIRNNNDEVWVPQVCI